MYQFLEQYVTDKGDFFMASFTTHQPEPSQYSAPPSDLPLGKLLELEVPLVQAVAILTLLIPLQ